jgi:hypothetical protein
MSMENSKHSPAQRFLRYINGHRVSVSLFLAVYGAVYLLSVVSTGWTLADWGKDVSGYPPPFMPGVLPRSFLNPFFYVTSIPSLLVGTVALCVYCIRGINSQVADDKEHVAILLTATGFAYQVLGAWPLGVKTVFPWEWQKQIIGNGAVFAWMLTVLSLVALVIGGTSVYLHSRIYSHKHPEFKLEPTQP